MHATGSGPQGLTPRSAAASEWVVLVIAVRPRAFARFRGRRSADRLRLLAPDTGTIAAADPRVQDHRFVVLLLRADVSGILDRAQELIADFGRTAPIHVIVCARREPESVQRTVARAEAAWRRSPTRTPGVRLVP